MDPTDRYQTCRTSKPGVREISTAGTANNINRVNELNRGGSVFPIPWNTLDVVNTIPAEMKFNETIRKCLLLTAITCTSREKMRISVAGAE